MKKKSFFIAAILFISTTCLSQTTNSGDSVKKRVEIEASFPGGDPAWRLYLKRSLDYNVPVKNEAPAGIYEVIIKFVVTVNGSLSDIKAETNNGYGMEDEAIRVIKQGRKWKPASINGKNVNAYRRQTLTFTVSED